MSAKQLFLGTVILGVIANVMDGVIWGGFLGKYVEALPGMTAMSAMIPWYIGGDFVMAAIFTWFYGIVRNSFSSGMKYGLVTAFVIAFPGQILFSMGVKDFPMWLAWVGVVVYLIEWSILGMILEKIAKPKTVSHASASVSTHA